MGTKTFGRVEWAVVLLAPLVVLGSCSSFLSATGRTTSASMVKSTVPPVTVTVTQERTVEATRTVEAVRTVEVTRTATLATTAPAPAQSQPAPAPAAPTSNPAAAPLYAPATNPAPAGVYYASCADAKAKGAAPLRVSDPGYRSGLDRDGDGVACEK